MKTILPTQRHCLMCVHVHVHMFVYVCVSSQIYYVGNYSSTQYLGYIHECFIRGYSVTLFHGLF